MALMDTNIAIYLRDRDPDMLQRVARLPAIPQLSLVSWVELEGGVLADPAQADQRRVSLDGLLASLSIIPVDAAIVRGYRNIVQAIGFSRRRILDRLIAATAIVHDLTLITINAADFRDIPGLKLEAWPAPAAQ